jgi:hypothetical protein
VVVGATSLRETDAANQIVETRVRAKWIQKRKDFEPGNVIGTLLIRVLQPDKGLLSRNAHPPKHAPLKLGYGLPSGVRRRLAAPQCSTSETCTTQVGLRLAVWCEAPACRAAMLPPKHAPLKLGYGLPSGVRRRLAAPLRHSLFITACRLV